VNENRNCGGSPGNIGLTITWALDPPTNKSGFILQHVEILEDEKGVWTDPGWYDYTEVWKVEGGSVLSTRDEPNKDQFCVEKSKIINAKRKYIATAWFVEGNEDQATTKGLTRKDQKIRRGETFIKTAGWLRHKVGEMDSRDRWNRRFFPSLDRTVIISKGRVDVECKINRDGHKESCEARCPCHSDTYARRGRRRRRRNY
jgi:hypothetical protein